MDLDGAVTIGDAVLPARLVAGDSTLQIDKAAVSNGDMDKNGMFTANDMTLILNRITGIC